MPSSSADRSPFSSPCGTPADQTAGQALPPEQEGGIASLARLQKALLDWFAANRRDLPWRRDYAPYGVWISEIMLQQTQMERGVAYYLAWMQRFPDIASLAAAREEDVLKAWEGLGYYSRARNILKAARLIVQQHHGLFPGDFEAIRSLPGVGPYTAAAIASIAFRQDVACIDANVERVVSRLYDLDMPIRQEPGKTRLSTLARTLLPAGMAREHNQAMMELGALICGKKTRCLACPLQPWCQALRHGTVASRPVLPARQGRIDLSVASGLLVHKGRIYVQKRLPNDVWGGLWEFPGGGMEGDETPEQTIVREFGEESGFRVRVLGSLGVLRTSYTKFNITLHCLALDFAAMPACGDGALPQPPALHEASEYRWVTLEELAELAMPSAHRKLAAALSLHGDRLCCSLPDSLLPPPKARRRRRKEGEASLPLA